MSEKLKNFESKTKLIIEKDESLIGANRDSGVDFEIKGIKLGRTEVEGNFSYYKLQNLTNTKNVELLIRDSEGIKKVGLPNPMFNRLAEYLRNERDLADYNFDCSAFAHFMNDVPYEPGTFDLNNGRWEIDKADENSFKQGDTVLLLQTYEDNKNPMPVHFALYIGDGLYISKFGTGGRLIATNADEMKKAFEANVMIRVSPKKEYQNAEKVSMKNYKKPYKK